MEEINTSAEFVSMREKESKAMLSKETEGCALNSVTAKSHLRPAPRLEDRDVAGTSTVTVRKERARMAWEEEATNALASSRTQHTTTMTAMMQQLPL